MYFLLLSLLAVPDSAAPWSLAHRAPLSVELPGKNTIVGLPSPSTGDLPDPGIKPGSLVTSALAADFCYMGQCSNTCL